MNYVNVPEHGLDCLSSRGISCVVNDGLRKQLAKFMTVPFKKNEKLHTVANWRQCSSDSYHRQSLTLKVGTD